MAKIIKELHLFMPIGDDEIQVESWDKSINEKVMKLKKAEPDSVVIIYDDDYPAFLRAAVKMKNITVSFHKTKDVTEAQKKARSENGNKTKGNLKNV